MKHDFHQQLNEQQLEAVRHKDGPALVVAGPGSGKTRVLTHRIEHLISAHNIDPLQILCVTFTNKAANEIKERIFRQTGIALTWGGTFHSICARILRKDGYKIGINPGFVIYDSNDQKALIKGILKDFGINPKQTSEAGALATISSAKNELISPQEFEKTAHGYHQRTVAKIFPEYQRRLRANQALDFDDLLSECVHLLKTDDQTKDKYQSLFKYVLVDEYQDTNKAQYVLTKLLSDLHKNLFVVGDMAQAIYSFRGADYRNIINFEKDFPNAKVYRLEKNYRSNQTILDAATSLIKNNKTHIHLELWTEKKVHEKIKQFCANDQNAEALYVVNEILQKVREGHEYSAIAVLYRTNAQSRNIEESLIRANIPYRIVGGFRFYARKEIKDLICYLKAIQNPKDSVAWERIVNTPPRGIGKVTQASLQAKGWDLNDIVQKTGVPFDIWHENKDSLSTLELLEDILEKTKYVSWIDDKTEESRERIENINELKSVASTFLALPDFLENVALIESSDKPREINGVTLMTIHASKGLEFKTVFIVGMEEGLFPHTRSMGDLNELEEERRLCYVAITRAMDNLHITTTKSRLYFGRYESNMPSRFLNEIPQNLVEKTGETLETKWAGMVDDLELELNRQNFSW